MRFVAQAVCVGTDSVLENRGRGITKQCKPKCLKTTVSRKSVKLLSSTAVPAEFRLTVLMFPNYLNIKGNLGIRRKSLCTIRTCRGSESKRKLCFRYEFFTSHNTSKTLPNVADVQIINSGGC